MKKLTNEEFINKCQAIYDNYDYSKTLYDGCGKKVIIICEEHGEFEQTPTHLLSGHGCQKCGIARRGLIRSSNTTEFIDKAIKVHDNKYTYEKSIYKTSNSKIIITCQDHGYFTQTPSSHLKGRCCPKCSKQSYKDTKESFIEKAKLVHGDRYDYSNVVYINCFTKIDIICKKHGVFNQTPIDHLQRCGCKQCKESKLETEVRNILKTNEISFKYDVRNVDWLKPLTLDFYIENKKIGIECQGEQHFRSIKYFGGDVDFEKRVINDNLKSKLCFENGIKLLYYSNHEYNDTIITDINYLIDEINNSPTL